VKFFMGVLESPGKVLVFSVKEWEPCFMHLYFTTKFLLLATANRAAVLDKQFRFYCHTMYRVFLFSGILVSLLKIILPLVVVLIRITATLWVVKTILITHPMEEHGRTMLDSQYSPSLLLLLLNFFVKFCQKVFITLH